jgi:hypothetical protein
VGDSHAGQWQPPLAAIASDEGWRLDTYTKGSCALTSAPTWLGTVDEAYTQCRQWNDAVVSRLLADPPDVVVTSNNQIEVADDDGSRLTGAAGDAAAVEGLQDAWRTLTEAGITVVVVGDTPWVGIDVPDEVPERRSGLAQQRAAAAAADVPLLDLTEQVCPGASCPAIVGGVLVWRDVSHVTASYVRTLEPELRDWLVPLVPAPSR